MLPYVWVYWMALVGVARDGYGNFHVRVARAWFQNLRTATQGRVHPSSRNNKQGDVDRQPHSTQFTLLASTTGAEEEACQACVDPGLASFQQEVPHRDCP